MWMIFFQDGCLVQWEFLSSKRLCYPNIQNCSVQVRAGENVEGDLLYSTFCCGRICACHTTGWNLTQRNNFLCHEKCLMLVNLFNLKSPGVLKARLTRCVLVSYNIKPNQEQTLMSPLCNGNIVKQVMVETSCNILSGDLFEECKKLVSIVSHIWHSFCMISADTDYSWGEKYGCADSTQDLEEAH